MKIYYWEKQLILYTKLNYGHIDYEHDLKYFAAKLYALDLQHTDPYNVFGMVVRLYEKLIDQGNIHFELETFLKDTFRRSNRERNKTDEVNHMDVMRQMLAEIQNTRVRDTILNLGEPDEEMIETLTALREGREGESWN